MFQNFMTDIHEKLKFLITPLSSKWYKKYVQNKNSNNNNDNKNTQTSLFSHSINALLRDFSFCM